MHRFRRTALLGAALVAIAVSGQSHGGSLGIEWNTSPGATGYLVRYGTSPETLDRTIDVRGEAQVVLEGLSDCTSWYATVTAYNSAGESAPSAIVTSWPRPLVSSLEPVRMMQGEVARLTLRGTNLAPDARVETGGAGLSFEPLGGSCGTLELDVTAEPTSAGRRPATVGTFPLTVRSPEGLAASRPFEVVIDPSRFDVSRSVPSTAGRIDGVDVVWVARRFGGQDGDSIYHPDLDFDGDGWIDGEEIARLGSNLGLCWSGSDWTAACPPGSGVSP